MRLSRTVRPRRPVASHSARVIRVPAVETSAPLVELPAVAGKRSARSSIDRRSRARRVRRSRDRRRARRSSDVSTAHLFRPGQPRNRTRRAATPGAQVRAGPQRIRGVPRVHNPDASPVLAPEDCDRRQRRMGRHRRARLRHRANLRPRASRRRHRASHHPRARRPQRKQRRHRRNQRRVQARAKTSGSHQGARARM